VTAGSLRAFARPRVWVGVWIFGWVLAIALSLIPPPPLHLDIDNSDKLGHLLAYATLSAWAVMVFARPRAWVVAALALVALGIGMEIAQGMLTEWRMRDWRDAVANTLGVGLGLLVAMTPAQRWLEAADRRWFR
jgi:VanZ family protein